MGIILVSSWSLYEASAVWVGQVGFLCCSWVVKYLCKILTSEDVLGLVNLDDALWLDFKMLWKYKMCLRAQHSENVHSRVNLESTVKRKIPKKYIKLILDGKNNFIYSTAIWFVCKNMWILDLIYWTCLIIIFIMSILFNQGAHLSFWFNLVKCSGIYALYLHFL